jgi:hypothetical protein
VIQSFQKVVRDKGIEGIFIQLAAFGRAKVELASLKRDSTVLEKVKTMLNQFLNT